MQKRAKLKCASLKKSLSKKFTSLSMHGGDIRRVFMLGQKLKLQNPNISLIDLSLGNPDVEPPEEVDKSLITILKQKEKSSHRYMDAAGLPEIREYIAEQLSLSENITVNKDSVYLTVGAAGGLQILFRSFLEEGDEVIIFSPYFPEYMPYILNYNATPVICPCDENHQPNLEYFSKCLTNKTKLILLNSPNNPTGVIYSKNHLMSLFSMLTNHFKKLGQIIHVVSDEPYSRVAYCEESFPRILSLYPYTWIVRSFSKDLCLAGERVGYIAWSESLFQQFPESIDVFRNASRMIGFVSAPRLMQRLIPSIFNLKVNVSIYENRTDVFFKYLISHGFDVVKPEAGFFIFPKSPILDDRAFCNDLINFGVLCVPGSGFGCPGYFRASLTQELVLIEEAAKRIVDCSSALKESA